MKVLIHHDKHGDAYFDVSTPGRRRAAYLTLALRLDARGYYDGVTDARLVKLRAAAGPALHELEWHQRRSVYLAGCQAAVLWLTSRSCAGAEYEGIGEIEVELIEAPPFDK